MVNPGGISGRYRPADIWTCVTDSFPVTGYRVDIRLPD